MDLFKYNNYLIIRQTASMLASTIRITDTNHGEIIAIESKMAMMLPKIQLRFC